MAKRVSKYKRCKKCKQLVSNVDDCGYCKAGRPEQPTRYIYDGKRPKITSDIQDGNNDV